MRVLLMFLSVLLSVQSVVAATYSVSTSGSDTNSCTTAAQSCASSSCTTAKATVLGSGGGGNGGIACLHPGDTLDLRAGTYNDALVWPGVTTIPSGTDFAANAITIQGHAGETVTFSNGINIQANIDSSVVSNLIFSHLSMPYFRLAGGSHHIRLTQSDVFSPPCDMDIVLDSTVSFIEVTHTLVHDAKVCDNGQYGITTSLYGFYANGKNLLIDHNTIYNNSGYAVHLFLDSGSGVNNNTISNNLIYGNAYNDGQRNIDVDAIILSSGSGNVAYNNVLYGNGNSSHAVNGGGGGGLTIYNCSGCAAYNNTIYGSVGIPLSAQSSSNPTMTNNIIFGSGMNRIVDNGGNTSITTTTNLCGDNTGLPCIVTSDPKFVNTTTHDFHLQAGSPANGQGTNLTSLGLFTTDFDAVARPSSSAWDIGAYQFVASCTPGVATALGFLQQPTTTAQNGTITPSPTVHVFDNCGSIVTSSAAAITVAIGTNPGSGTLNGTLTQNALNGGATFTDLSITAAGNGYTLTATSSGLTTANSTPFNITAASCTAGVAAALHFEVMPTTTLKGTTLVPAPTVHVRDDCGNRVTSSSATVMVVLTPAAGGLNGTVSVTASAGIATFSTLSVTSPGTDYALGASSSGLTSALSATFNISAARKHRSHGRGLLSGR